MRRRHRMKGRCRVDGAVDVHALRAQPLKKTCPVRRRRQDDRGIAGVQGGGNKARKAIDNRCVIRTEENLVTTWRRSTAGSANATLRLTNRWPASTASIAGSRSVPADACECNHGRPD